MRDLTTTCAIIKNSIFELTNKKPLKEIKVKDILQNAKIPKSSFYYNYHSLDEVIEEMMDDFLVKLYDKTYRSSNIPNYIDGAVSMNITLFIEDNLYFLSQLLHSNYQVSFITKMESIFIRLIINRFYKEQLIPCGQLSTTAQMLAYGFVTNWAQNLCSPTPRPVAQFIYTLEHIMFNFIHTERKSPKRY